MSSDLRGTDLRTALGRTDNTAPAIQVSASAMMRLYDASPEQAVNEWRNALRTCRTDQLLPLLYVANEVLQISKRNRGNKFLEAFGGALGGSLAYICERDSNLVERVRRTTKIWGDRRVYSGRFVGELLSGLEPFRANSSRPLLPSSTLTSSSSSSPRGRPRRVFTPQRSRDDDDDDDDDDYSSPFGDSSSPQLELDIKNSLKEVATAASSSSSSGSKRRRSGEGGNPGPTLDKVTALGLRRESDRKKAKKALTGSSLTELVDEISLLGMRYRTAFGTISSVDPRHLDLDPSSVTHLFGDDLIDLSRDCALAIATARKQRIELRKVAVGRREVERESLRYVPWLMQMAKSDNEEAGFCDDLIQKLLALRDSGAHRQAREGRERRLDREARERAEGEARKRREEEERERRRGLEMAKKSAAEAKPGMVWNAAAREYQYMHDETLGEAWRD